MLRYLTRKLLFYPEKGLRLNPDDLSLDYEDVFILSSQFRIHGWYVYGQREETILFFHGNAGTIADRLDNVYRLVRRGYNVFIIDYRGYGLSEGFPSEQGTYQDAKAAWQWLQQSHTINPDKIVLFGRSLGGAVALDLALKMNPYRLILESTFISVKELGHHLMPIVPKVLIPNVYPNADRIGKVTTPLLIIHGTGDSLVPFLHAEVLYDCAKEPKFLFPIKHADHGDTYLRAGEKYFEVLAHFINDGTL